MRGPSQEKSPRCVALADKNTLYSVLFACKIKKSHGNALTLCEQSLRTSFKRVVSQPGNPQFPILITCIHSLMKRLYTPRRIHFIIAFAVMVVAFSIMKCTHPEWLLPREHEVEQPQVAAHEPDSIELQAAKVDQLFLKRRSPLAVLKADGTPVKNRVTSVPRFETSFPDLNDVQYATASRLGIPQIANREEAHRHMKDLVYIADNPFYTVQRLRQSIPYLVPRAAVLLNEIARAFNDSLVTKGYPPHKLLITSVLRTQEDVQRLRNFNQNASQNSCHQFGTTFDISYNRFLEIHEDGSSDIRWVTVYKSILAEVLNDMRQMGACYVKYEVHQSCFHITAR